MATRYLCLVAPAQDPLLERLQRWFANDPEIVIVVDRRRAQRRRAGRPVDHERRGTDRRRRSYVETQLGRYGWALVRATPARGSTRTE